LYACIRDNRGLKRSCSEKEVCTDDDFMIVSVDLLPC
jgi:hypothetical protein